MSKHLPPLSFHLLTPLYDTICAVVGFNIKFRLKIAEQIPDTARHIADIGCGTGAMTLLIKKRIRKATVLGIDPDEKALQRARKKAEKENVSVAFLNGIAQKLPLRPNSMDVVTSTLTLHHLPPSEKPKALAECWRVLKTGGIVVLADFGMPKSTVSKLLLKFIVLFEHGEENYKGLIEKQVREAGFKIISLTRIQMGVDIIVAQK